MIGSIKLTKDAGLKKYGYSGYGIRFDARSQRSLKVDEWSKNIVIFGVINSSSRQTDNRKKDVPARGVGRADGLDDTTVMAETKYSVNTTRSKQEISLSRRYNVVNNFCILTA